MTADFIYPAAASAALLIAIGGVCVMIGSRRAGLSLFLIGVALAVGAGSISSIKSLPSAPPLQLASWAGGMAGLIALALRRFRVAAAALWPICARWLVWPLVQPYVVANWGLVLLIIVPISPFILIWILQRVLAPIYGQRAAGHVSGEYLVRSIDAVGHVTRWLFLLPLRLVFLPFRAR